MDARNFTFVCDVDGRIHAYAGVAVTDIDNHVHIPLRPLMEHLKLDWKTMYDRANAKFSPTSHKLPSKRGVRDTFCLTDIDMHGLLGTVQADKLKPVERARLVGHFQRLFVNDVVTQCVTKSEPEANPPITEIYERASDIGHDALRRDLVRAGMPAEYINTAIQLNTIHFVNESVRGINPDVQPGTAAHTMMMGMAGKVLYSKFHLKPGEYKAGELFKQTHNKRTGARTRVLSYAKLEEIAPEHDLVRRTAKRFEVFLAGRSDQYSNDPNDADYTAHENLPEPWDLQKPK